ncbi:MULTISPECIES: outer membrane beta-barrel protein [unclassified Agarivorans]|uniref:outer membrane beta-barrel protein n=1 Tax=unclassified Agarivorans TaxID=2636026 RepID=UPI0026E1C4DE|nr:MULTISPECIES: outer membrane beta-barrel protein [unclassified Agarivorans]MDO6686253.1 outer membrane beta-barrel protein [Agarivorans sp. 3_MG-2023]MDO6716298.1 outer membrane beta-barrel protein [Agarivorans sp. 2_MG-2023]MDO6764784.1 outer membrane beta-barrel protein [Agarivorans sp. 1_MG-2023]
MFTSKRIKILFSIFAFLSISTSAQANTYAGAIFSYTSAEYTAEGSSSQEGKPWVLQAQVGHYFNDYLAVEGRYGVSTGRSGGISIDGLASLLVKGNIPLTEQIAMYGLLGGSSAKLDQQNVGSSTESGMSFGLGGHYALSKSSAITLEYLSSLNSDNAKIGGVNMAFQYRF